MFFGTAVFYSRFCLGVIFRLDSPFLVLFSLSWWSRGLPAPTVHLTGFRVLSGESSPEHHLVSVVKNDIPISRSRFLPHQGRLKWIHWSGQIEVMSE